MDKLLDKLFDNPWFIKIIAFVLALLLCQNVYDEKADTEENVPQDEQTEVIQNVPVKTYYDTKNLVVTGVPETVSVTLSGPKNILKQAEAKRDFEVYVDLTDAEIGEQKVPIQIKNISDKLETKIKPSKVKVSVQEKVTQEFPVEPEYDPNLISTGFIAETPTVKPNKVKITGAKNVIESISYVKAAVDLRSSINETVTKEAEILVLDKNLNKLNVIASPSKVEVTIPVKASSKKVPIKLVEEGTPPSGVAIDSIELSTEEATIIGKENVLKETDSVKVELDVSKISDDTTVTLPVIASKGVVKVSPETIKLKVKVKKESSKKFSSIPIETKGIDKKDYRIVFRDPENGSTSLTAFGKEQTIKGLKTSDFHLYIDLNHLGEGDHEVAIKVKGPSGIHWKLGQEVAQITILNKET